MISEVSTSESVQAAEACARTLAEDSGFDAETEAVSSSAPTLARQTVQRGLLDALALKHLHHDPELHAHLAPQDAIQRSLYDVFEQERYESLGCNSFRGIQVNLDARDLSEAMVTDTAHRQNSGVFNNSKDTARLIARAVLRLDNTIDQKPGFVTDSLLASLVTQRSDLLRELIADQGAYAKQICKLLEQWTQGMTEGHAADEKLDGAIEQGEDEKLTEYNDQSDEQDPLEESVEDEPGHFSDDDDRDASDADESVSGENDDAQTESQQLIDEAPIAGPDPVIVKSGDTQIYKSYTTEFDEVVHAGSWADQQAVQQWREELDQHLEIHTRVVRRLASRLQRVLLARQRRHWQFDMESGYLDASRLSRIVTQPMSPLSFKTESDMALRDTTVTLLIDNSRSMLGRPIMIAAACADILAQTLERCGVSVEILGFTTAHLHGGRSTELWESKGAPEHPGRLNDLRHIIYKSADTSYRGARKNLGVMLDRDLLKQNIDGEALQWAHQRLLKRQEQRKILMTISDGAPVDTSTLGANPGDYLARHLQTVVGQIEHSRDIELLAIGIGHDVSRFYSQAMSVYDARQLGPAMLNQLESLFRSAY